MKEIKNDFAENIEKQFGRGYKPRGLENEIRVVQNKKEKAIKLAQKVTQAKENYEKNPNEKTLLELNTIANEFEQSKAEFEQAEKNLSTGAVFSQNIPQTTTNLIPCEGEFNIADYYDVRIKADDDTSRIVSEIYEDTAISEIVGESERIPKQSLLDYIISVDITRDNIKKIASVLTVDETLFEDDKETLNSTIDRIQEKHSANTESLLLCKALQASKQSVNIVAESLDSSVNAALCAKAKKGAEIITNESGFSKLDIVDVNGIPLIKKNFTLGEFVYKDKYIVHTLSDELLPNNDDGTSPVFIGDWKNVLRIVIVKKYPPLEKLDIIEYSIENRLITYTIPLLTTTSDKAFIIGQIA